MKLVTCPNTDCNESYDSSKLIRIDELKGDLTAYKCPKCGSIFFKRQFEGKEQPELLTDLELPTSKTEKQYHLCVGTLNDINEQVNKRLNEGWELYEAPFNTEPEIGQHEQRYAMYGQAMIRRG